MRDTIGHILIIVITIICSFETGRLVGRNNFRAQIKRMRTQIALLEFRNAVRENPSLLSEENIFQLLYDEHSEAYSKISRLDIENLLGKKPNG